LISYYTRGIYFHAAVIIGGVLYESREFKGVLRREPEAIDPLNFDDFYIEANDQQIEQMTAFAERQLGKKYDYAMVVRFITKQKQSKASIGKWFCSELVFAVLKKAGIKLLNCQAWEVSPVHLAKSPFFFFFYAQLEDESDLE
jgi:uncharacterized protein YycO